VKTEGSSNHSELRVETYHVRAYARRYEVHQRIAEWNSLSLFAVYVMKCLHSTTMTPRHDTFDVSRTATATAAAAAAAAMATKQTHLANSRRAICRIPNPISCCVVAPEKS